MNVQAELEELLPCPFCGGTEIYSSKAMGVALVRCEDCGGSCSSTSSAAQAYDRWNCRASAPGQQNTDGASTGVSQASVAAEVAPQPSTTLSAPQAQPVACEFCGNPLARPRVCCTRGAEADRATSPQPAPPSGWRPTRLELSEALRQWGTGAPDTILKMREVADELLAYPSPPPKEPHE